MSLYDNDTINTRELIPFYKDKYTIDYVVDRKYGDHTVIENDKDIKEINNDNRLITYNDLRKIGLIDNSNKTKYRINQLLEEEDLISEKYTYTYIRLDLYPDRTICPDSDLFYNFINSLNEKIETNESLRYIIIGTIGNIELSDSDKWHLHYGLFIDCDMVNPDKFTLLIDDITDLTRRLIKIDYPTLINSSLNRVDMSKTGSSNRYYPVNDKKSRNNVRALLPYQCKESMSQKSSIEIYNARSHKLFRYWKNKFKEYSVLEEHWYKKLNRLMDMRELVVYRYQNTSNIYLDSRLSTIFEFENNIFKYYNHYYHFSFTVKILDKGEEYQHEKLLLLLDIFNSNRKTKTIDPYFIGYNWSLVHLDGYWTMEWSVFMYFPDDIVPIVILDTFISRIQKWFLSTNPDLIINLPDRSELVDIVKIQETDIENRNVIRNKLIQLSFTTHETKEKLEGSKLKCFGHTRLSKSLSN